MDESINILYLELVQPQSGTLSARDPEGKWDVHCIIFFKKNLTPTPRPTTGRTHLVEQLHYTWLFIVTQHPGNYKKFTRPGKLGIDHHVQSRVGLKQILNLIETTHTYDIVDSEIEQFYHTSTIDWYVLYYKPVLRRLALTNKSYGSVSLCG